MGSPLNILKRECVGDPTNIFGTTIVVMKRRRDNMPTIPTIRPGEPFYIVAGGIRAPVIIVDMQVQHDMIEMQSMGSIYRERANTNVVTTIHLTCRSIPEGMMLTLEDEPHPGVAPPIPVIGSRWKKIHIASNEEDHE